MKFLRLDGGGIVEGRPVIEQAGTSAPAAGAFPDAETFIWKPGIPALFAIAAGVVVRIDPRSVADTRYVLQSNKSSKAQAEAGTDNAKWMTPLRVAQAIDAQETFDRAIYAANNGAPVDYTNAGHWSGAIQSTSSEVTFNVTTDGTSNGPALFDNLNACGFSLACRRDTNDNDEAPWASIRRIDAGKRVVVRVWRSNTGGIFLGGSYAGNEPNNGNVVIYLTIKGDLA